MITQTWRSRPACKSSSPTGRALRQTEGFVRSVFEMMGLGLDVPDYTLLSKRQSDVEVDLPAGGGSGGAIRHLVMDATGLKVHGEGEWKQRTHGKQKRRTWRKMHLGVDPDTGMITAAVLTDNTESDAAQVEALLEETEAGGSEDGSGLLAVYADGAYDMWDAREAITDRAGATPVIPPQKNAKIKKHGNASGPPLPRDEAIRYLRSHGRGKWKREHGYHRRSLGGMVMYRQAACRAIRGGKAVGLRTKRSQTRSESLEQMGATGNA